MIERFVCPFMPPAHCLFHCPFLLRYPIPTPTLPLKGREGAEPGQGESASTAMMSQADRRPAARLRYMERQRDGLRRYQKKKAPWRRLDQGALCGSFGRVSRKLS